MNSPKTYQISTIEDLLKVPMERREECVKELLIALSFIEFAAGDEPIVFRGSILWTDDGNPSCDLVVNGEDIRLEIVKVEETVK